MDRFYCLIVAFGDGIVSLFRVLALKQLYYTRFQMNLVPIYIEQFINFSDSIHESNTFLKSNVNIICCFSMKIIQQHNVFISFSNVISKDK